MNSLITLIATLVAGVILVGIGVADLFTKQRLTIAGDIGFIVAGCGALGVHVTNTATTITAGKS